MTRDELKEKVATAIMNRFIKPDMHETVAWADGSKQWRFDHFGEMADVALSAIEDASMTVVPVEATEGVLAAMDCAPPFNKGRASQFWAAQYAAMVEAGRVR